MKRRDLLWLVFVTTMPRTARPFTAQPPRSVPLFEFHSNFWMNLHHTLFREAARLESRTPLAPLDASGLTDQEKAAWGRAVGYYRQAFGGKRLLFDDGLIHINESLAATSDDRGHHHG